MFLIAAQAAQTDGGHLERLREEIRIIEDRLNEAEAGQRGIVEQLMDLDKQIDLRRKVMFELTKQADGTQQKLGRLNDNIADLTEQIAELNLGLAHEETNLERLRRQVGSRLADLYKHTVPFRVTVLFGSRSLNDLFQRRQYLQAVERYDRARIQKLREKVKEVTIHRENLQSVHSQLELEKLRRMEQLERLQLLLVQHRSEGERLAGERRQKQKLLERIAGNAELLRALLDERRNALAEIEREMRRLEKRTAAQVPDFLPDVPFGGLSGKLPWPLAKNRITVPYGQIRHPKLGTTTVNPGIDLAASAGEPVFAVGHGRITRITYLRGFGNTVIIDHGTGHYTVYARLGDIFVGEGEVVRPGQTIGEVGEAGSDTGLHFEVWTNRSAQDPTKWLRR